MDASKKSSKAGSSKGEAKGSNGRTIDEFI